MDKTTRQKIWGTQLKRWEKAAGWTHKILAEKVGAGERTIQSWAAGNVEKLHPANLAQLLTVLFDATVADPLSDSQPATAEARHGKVWQHPEEVLNWMWLLGYNRADVLALPLNTDVRNWLSTEAIAPMVWNSPALPTTHIQRTETAALVSALTDLRDDLTPTKRVVVLHGPPGSGKTTLAAALMNQPAVRDYFRHGGQFLPEESVHWLVQAGAPTLPGDVGQALSPYQNWWEWLSNENTVGLVVIDDLTDGSLLQQLLARTGRRVRCLVTTQDRDQIVVGASSVALKKIHVMAVGGLTEAEAEQLAGQLWQRALSETDRLNLTRLHRQVSRPAPLRLLLAEVVDTSWEMVCQWLALTSDEQTPLGQYWSGLLTAAWQRRSTEEQHWLGELAGAGNTTGSVGAIYAGWVWQISTEEASARLVTLARRGWLEQVTESSLADIGPLWASTRFRFGREMWGYVRHELPLRHSRWARLRWTAQLYRQVSRELELRPVELARRAIRRWVKSDEVDEFWQQLRQRDELGRWLRLSWSQYWLQPPIEVIRLVKTGRRGSYIFGGLSWLCAIPLIIGAYGLWLNFWHSPIVWGLVGWGMIGTLLLTFAQTLTYEAPVSLARRVVATRAEATPEPPTSAAPPPSSPTASEPRSTDTGDNPVE